MRRSRHSEPHQSLLIASTLVGLEPIASEEIAARLHASAEVIGPGVLSFKSAASRRRLAGVRCVLSMDLVVAEIAGDYLRARALAALGHRLKRVRFDSALERLCVSPAAPAGFRVLATVPERSHVHFFDVQRVAADAISEALGWTPAISAAGAPEPSEDEVVVTLRASHESVLVGLRVPSVREAKTRPSPSREQRVLAAAMLRLARLSPGQLCAEVCYTAGVPLPPPSVRGGSLRVIAGGSHAKAVAPRARHGWAVVWRPHALALASDRLDRLFCFVSRGRLRADRVAYEFARVLKPNGLAIVAAPRELGLCRALEAHPTLQTVRFVRVRMARRRMHLMVARKCAGPG
ncbi:MAG: hypothetical protein ACE5O2_05755 [Armatimonadota bacterium]